MAVICAAAEGRALIKKNERKKAQQRLLRPFVCLYLSLLSSLLSNSSRPTCKFHACYTSNVKFSYVHFSALLLLMPNFIAFKFNTPLEIILYLQLQILLETTGLQPKTSTCKIHYLQIHSTRLNV